MFCMDHSSCETADTAMYVDVSMAISRFTRTAASQSVLLCRDITTWIIITDVGAEEIDPHHRRD